MYFLHHSSCALLFFSLLLGITNGLIKVNDFQPRQIAPKIKPRRSTNSNCNCIVNFDTRAYSEDFFFHLHIPKTGGRTFLDCLNCWNKHMVITPDVGFLCYGVNIPNLKSLVQNKTKRVVSCEIKEERQLSYILHELNMPALKIITHIRKPVELLFSAVIQYYTDRSVYNPCRNFREIIEADMNPDAMQCERYSLQNIQTSALSPGKVADVGEAVAFLSKNVYHFGITTFYRASLCLLAYQMGQLRMHSTCDCSKNSEFSIRQSNLNENKAGHGEISSEQLLSAHDMKVLEKKYINLDNMLYHIALDLFVQRILLAERETRMQLLCSATDGPEIMVLKSSIKDPQWYGSFMSP